ncbi:FAD-dependent oxidoreductase [Micromonosporaceae bacterium Da 78-11]
MISRRNLLISGSGAALGGLGLLRGDPVSAAASRSSVHQLSPYLQGEVVVPSSPSYATAKQLELAQFDAVSPRAVVYCACAEDVSLAVRYAQHYGLPVAVRSGGHSYAGYSTTPGVIIDLSRLNSVVVGAGTVTIGPGAQNVDVLNTLAPHGLVVSEGGCPTVAAGGFLQGGGFGFLTRPLGMACDAIASAQVVLADGSIVTASSTQETDLFWAIRGGGGGNFGVVTSFTVVPHAGDQMSVATLSFAYDDAADVLDGVTNWLPDAPRSIGGGAYVVQPDAVPGSVPVVNVMLASRGTPAELTAETNRLVALTGPATSRQEFALTYQQLMMTVFGCGDLSVDQCRRSEKTPAGVLGRPAFGLERTRLGTDPYPSSGWAAVMSAFDADRYAGQARYLDLHMFGGAANDPARTDTAYVHRDSLFSVNYRVLINDPQASTSDAKAVAKRWVDRGFATIDPLSNRETYQNWMDPALTDWKKSYYAENYSRLAAIKAEYDPNRFFRFRQAV